MERDSLFAKDYMNLTELKLCDCHRTFSGILIRGGYFLYSMGSLIVDFFIFFSFLLVVTYCFLSISQHIYSRVPFIGSAGHTGFNHRMICTL